MQWSFWTQQPVRLPAAAAILHTCLLQYVPGQPAAAAACTVA